MIILQFRSGSQGRHNQSAPAQGHLYEPDQPTSSRSSTPREAHPPATTAAVGGVGSAGGGGGSRRRAKFNDDSDDERDNRKSSAPTATIESSSAPKSDGTIKYLVASSADKNFLDADEVKKYFVNFGKVAWCSRSGAGNTAAAFTFEDLAVCKSVLQYGHRIKRRPIWLQGMGGDGKPIGKPTVAREIPQ